MAIRDGTPITIGRIDALSHDITDNPVFHRKVYESLPDSLRYFLTNRATQLFPHDPNGASRALTLVTELAALARQEEFASSMTGFGICEPSVATAIPEA